MSLALRRTLARAPGVTAVLATMVVAVLVLTLLQAFTVLLAQRTVADVVTSAPAVRRAALVTGGLGGKDLPAMDAAVTAAAADHLPRATVDLAARSVSYGLGDGGTDLVQLVHLDGIEAHATLLDGTWPASAGGAAGDGATGDGATPAGPVDVAVPESAAAALGWRVGTEATLENRLPTGPPGLAVVVTGIYRAQDAADPFWLGDPFGTSGVEVGERTTYGPLVVTGADFAALLTASASATWRIYPDVTTLSPDAVADLRARTSALLADLADDPTLPDARVSSPLPDLLATAAGTRARAETALLVPTVLLLLLAGAAVALAGALLAELRAGEDRLLLARGASRAQMLALAAAEAAGIAVVATVVAALGARPLAVVLARAGSGAAGDITVPAGASAGTVWLTAATVAAVLGAVLTATSARRAFAAPPGTVRATHARLAAAGRSGVDLVLVGLGVVAYLQLHRREAQPGPLTVLAPALILLAAAAVSLRLLPLLTRAGAVLTRRSRGLPVAWAGWQAGRRLVHQGGLVLLLVLAVAMGSLALVHRATADRAEADRAAHEVGADLRVDLPTAPATDSLTLEDRLATGIGREHLLPVVRATTSAGTLDDVTVLAVDAGRAAVMALPDGAGTGARLLETRPTVPTLPLPGRTRDVAVTVSGTADPATTVALVLQDGSGLRHVVDLVGGQDGPDGRTWAAQLPAGAVAPLAVAAIDVDRPVRGFDEPARPEPRVVAVTVAAEGAAPSPVAGGTRWRWLTAETAPWGEPTRVVAVPDVVPETDLLPLAAVVTPGVLRATGADLGETVRVPWRGQDLPLVVAGTVASVPTVDGEGIILDLPSVIALGTTADERGAAVAVVPPRVLQWWAELPGGAALDADVAADLPRGTTVLTRAGVAARLAGDPLAVGMSGALTLVAVAALVLAVLGHGATTVTSTRRHRADLAVLQSLGARTGAVRAALLLERTSLVAATALLGLVLGTLAARAVVPLTVLSTTAAGPVDVVTPWAQLGAFGAVLLGVLIGVTALLVRPLRPGTVPVVLREGVR